MGYVKQGFKDGDVLNASQLVEIEQGIQDNETEIAKKAERVVFSMHATSGGNGVYALEFEDGAVYNDVTTAIIGKKDVYIQIHGNEIFMNNTVWVLPYAGVASTGASRFSCSLADGAEITVVSAILSGNGSTLVEMSPITSIDDGTEVSY